MGNWFDKNKFFEKLLILTWVVFLFICIGLLSFTSHAESSYFPMNQNDNNNIPESYYSIFDTYLDTENYYVVIRNGEIFSDGLGFWYVRYPKQDDYGIFGEVNSDGHSFSLYNFGSSNTNYTNGRLSITYDGQVYHNVYNQNPFTNFMNVESSLYSTSYSYISNFKIYSNNNPDTQIVILKYGPDPVEPDIGHATHPHFDGLHPHYGNTVTPPDEVPPTYTINNYSWTTYNNPPVDNSSTDALLESIFDILSYNAGYLQTNISNEFDNLLNNLSGLISYLGETLQYYGDLIIANIQNGIQNFYDNMVSLVEPIFEKLDYISEPIDGTIIYDNISSTSLITNYNSVNTALTSFKTSFDNLSEPSSFTIPIHLENLPSAYFGNQTTQYIDLGVIGSTEKGLIRTFMWALITYGLFITIVDSVSNYINGGGDES